VLEAGLWRCAPGRAACPRELAERGVAGAGAVLWSEDIGLVAYPGLPDDEDILADGAGYDTAEWSMLALDATLDCLRGVCSGANRGLEEDEECAGVTLLSELPIVLSVEPFVEVFVELFVEVFVEPFVEMFVEPFVELPDVLSNRLFFIELPVVPYVRLYVDLFDIPSGTLFVELFVVLPDVPFDMPL